MDPRVDEPDLPEELPNDLPGALSKDLQALFRAPGQVPGEVDDAILSAAREELAPRVRRPRLTLVRTAAAAAAAVLLIVFLDRSLVSTRTGEPELTLAESEETDRHDVDRNGRVDILDALVLARAVESGSGLDEAWDLNRDAVVDGRDVDLVAERAVRIEG